MTDKAHSGRSRNLLWRSGLTILTVFMLLAAIIPVHAGDAPADISNSSVSTYIVVFNDTPKAMMMSAQSTSSLVTSCGGEVTGQLSMLNGMTVKIPDSEASSLMALPNVKYVEKDEPMYALLDQAVPQIGADQAWAEGYTGQGVKVAVLDTGVNNSHPDLNGNKVIAWKDFTGGGYTSPHDGHGHGTHVSGIIAGTGAASNGKYKGVAPNASLIEGKVLDDSGMGSTSNIILAMDWAVSQGAQVISLSLGGNHIQAMDDEITKVTNEGVVVVVAAGNTGPYSNTIQCPGDAPAAITVGAVDKSDAIASFSSRGPTTNGSVKPDVTNVGVSVMSAKAGGTAATGYYVYMSGTSMATPMTSGVVALMLQRNSSLTPVQVKNILEKTAKPMGSGVPNNDYGWGRVQAKYAVDNDSTQNGPMTGLFYDDFESGNLNNWTFNTPNNGVSQVLDIVNGKGLGGSRAAEVYQTYEPGWNGDSILYAPVYSPSSGSGTGKATFWFYDDASYTGSQYVFMVNGNDPILRINSDKALLIGADSGSPNYLYMVWTGYPSYSNASSVARSTGWHNFTMIADGARTRGYIDGQLIVTTTVLNSFNYIEMGTLWASGHGIYYDNVSVTSLYSIRLTSDQDTMTSGGDTDVIHAQLYYNDQPCQTSNINVTFSSDNDSVATLPSLKTFKTDANGKVQVPLTSQAQAGIVNVTATTRISASSITSDRKTVSVINGANLTGIIEDRDSLGIMNANVSLWSCVYDPVHGRWNNTVPVAITSNPQLSNDGRTSPAGSYTFWRVPTGTYNVTGEKNGHINNTIVNLTTGTYTADLLLADYEPSRFNYTLQKGWNMISLPLTLSNDSVDAFFPDDVKANVSDMWYYNNGSWVYYSGTLGYSSKYAHLTNVTPGRGYWVKLLNNTSFTITGEDSNHLPAINTGWTMFSVESLNSFNATSAYPSCKDMWYYDNGQWYYYSDTLGYSSKYPHLASLDPGKGYWVHL